MNFLLVAQLFSILGSGLLTQPIVRLMGSPSTAVWLSSSLNVASAALNPILSQAVDYWGRKWILVATTTSGLVGAIIVSRAQDIATVLVGFCLIAIMFGGQAASFAVVGEILPRKYRAIGQASLNISQCVAGISGVLFAGALVQDGRSENYRSYFYLLAGLFAVATAAIAVFYNPPLRELQMSLTQTEKLRSLDWIGILTFTFGAVLFSIGLAWSNSPYSWNNPHILGTFVPGIALLLLFCVYEWRFKKDGIAHHGLFMDKNYEYRTNKCLHRRSCGVHIELLSCFGRYHALWVEFLPSICSLCHGLRVCNLAEYPVCMVYHAFQVDQGSARLRDIGSFCSCLSSWRQ
jgi:MFS family permease